MHALTFPLYPLFPYLQDLEKAIRMFTLDDSFKLESKETREKAFKEKKKERRVKEANTPLTLSYYKYLGERNKLGIYMTWRLRLRVARLKWKIRYLTIQKLVVDDDDQLDDIYDQYQRYREEFNEWRPFSILQ